MDASGKATVQLILVCREAELNIFNASACQRKDTGFFLGLVHSGKLKQ